MIQSAGNVTLGMGIVSIIDSQQDRCQKLTDT